MGAALQNLTLTQHFVADFVCFDKIIIEIKAVASLTDAHRAQLLNYLHATKHELGILVNFGRFPKLVYERLICNRRTTAVNSSYEILASKMTDLD